jgi:N-acetylglutamate synthase-like GNAT family acetyltransferase
MEVTIRVANPNEINVIIDLQTLALSNLPAEYRVYSQKQVDSLVKGQAESRRNHVKLETILVAESEDQDLVGFACLSNFTPHIYGIFVHPDCMGKGIGTNLLAWMEAMAVQRKMRNLFVVSSIEAVEFYENNGYDVQHNHGFFSADYVWIQCKVLKKELSPTPPIEIFANKFLIMSILVALVVIVLKRLFS